MTTLFHHVDTTKLDKKIVQTASDDTSNQYRETITRSLDSLDSSDTLSSRDSDEYESSAPGSFQEALFFERAPVIYIFVNGVLRK